MKKMEKKNAGKKTRDFNVVIMKKNREKETEKMRKKRL